MKHNLSIYKELSRLATVTLVYLLIFTTILTIYEQQIAKPYFLLGIPIILGCFWGIQRYCYQPIVYLLLHGIFYMPVMMIPFPNAGYHYLYIGLLISEDIRAIYAWRHTAQKEYDEAPWYLFFFTVIIYIAAIGFHQEHLAGIVYYIGISFLLLHFIRYFLTGINRLLSQSLHATTMPTRKIMLTNLTLFIFLLSAFLSLVLLARLFEFDSILYTIGDLLIKFIRLIINLLLYMIAVIRLMFASDTAKQNTSEESQNLSDAVNVLSEPSLLAKIITVILELTVITLILYILYRIIASLVKMFLRRYALDSDIVVALDEKKEITKPQIPKEPLLSKLKSLFGTSNASKIRQAYRLKINSYKELAYKKNDTPADIANKVLNVYDEDISELTGVYEKARYSNEEITQEDIQKGGIL